MCKYHFWMLLPLLLFVWHETHATETVWIEAEHLEGVRGSCFPDMDGKTAGHWGLSGPGIAPEWTQGGESEWLSIACGPDDGRAMATASFEIPETGQWKLWVRYRDWRELAEVFAVSIEQEGQAPALVTFGERPVVDENDELKLLWRWAFGWDARPLPLVKGSAKLTLMSTSNQPGHRQVDCFCLTTDENYRPFHREKPIHQTWTVLEQFRSGQAVVPQPLASRAGEFAIPEAWKPLAINGQPFLYLWNVGSAWEEDLASQDAKRVLFPFQTEPALIQAFREAYGGRSDVPIFSDPRITPAFYGAGPYSLENPHVAAWLEMNPGRPWALMMNYSEPKPLSVAAKAQWQKLRDRYVGNISGESLGHYVSYDVNANGRLQAATIRAEVLAAYKDSFLTGVAAKQGAVLQESVPNPYQDFIPCLSADMTAFAHASREWGARTVGYENTAVAPSLAMRIAFLRGSARQYGGHWATYRSSNFGDSATVYSEQSLYPGPKYVYDNSYDVWAGAGMTWYKFDIWHQYLSGSTMFYHEQGFDEFWSPGGGATPRKPIQLSPKGRLVDQFLRMSAAHPDRGVTFTPVAFLLDQAHGWDPTGFAPTYFGLDATVNPVLRLDRHGRMLKEWFKVAYYPYGPKEADINAGVNQIFIPGVFGNIFDVLVTSPSKMDLVASYPVLILNGEITLSTAWGKKLAEYMESGGTLIACVDQLTGPGLAEVQLPSVGAVAEDTRIKWTPVPTDVQSQRFRYRPIEGGQVLATAANGDPIAAAFPRGKGKLVYLSIPRGLGIDDSATPLVALVLNAAREGLMPVEVNGEVEWLLNRTADGWLVALFNPAGNNKQQHGVGPTDYSQERNVTIHTTQNITQATEWFTKGKLELATEGNERVIKTVIPAGGVRIIEIR